MRKEYQVAPVEKIVSREDTFNLMQLKVDSSGSIISRLPFQFDNMDNFDEEEIRKTDNFHERFIWKVSGNTALKMVPGEVFRLGRLRFRVREFSDGKKTQNIEVGVNLGNNDVRAIFCSKRIEICTS